MCRYTLFSSGLRGNGFELKIRLLGKTFQEIIEQGFGKDYQNNATYLDREWAVISGVAAL